jgi:hypothetical protein
MDGIISINVVLPRVAKVIRMDVFAKPEAIFLVVCDPSINEL